MAGCRPLSQWLSTPARSLMSDPTGASRVFCPGPDGHLTHTYTASSTAALLAVEQLPQPTLGQDLPAGLRPVLVIQWDPTRPWHPRHSAGQHQVPALGPHLVGAWSEGTVDPRSLGFSSVPAHEYVVRDSASRLRALRRILACQAGRYQPHAGPPSGPQHTVMSTAVSGDLRRAGQPGRQLRASTRSRSSQGPPGSGELQTPHQTQLGCIPPAPDRRRSGTGRLCSLPC